MRYEVRQNEFWGDSVNQSFPLAEVDIDLGWTDAEIVRAVSKAVGLDLDPADWEVWDSDESYLELCRVDDPESRGIFSLHKIEE